MNNDNDNANNIDNAIMNGDTSNAAADSSVKNMNDLQQSKVPAKRAVRRAVKQPPDRPRRALFVFTMKNPLRKLCIDVVEWKYPSLFFLFSF